MRATPVAILTCVGACLALASCEEPMNKDRSPLATEQAATVLDRPRAPGEDNGLEVARWSVTGDDARIRRAFARHATRLEPALGAASIDVNLEALERAGLRAAIVRDSDLSSLLAELGGTTMAMVVWHGQIPEWREIATAPIDPGRVVMIDGKAERLGTAGGAMLRCMARGWTVPLEEGAVFELHVGLQLVTSKNDYSALLNRDVLRGRVFSDVAIDIDMPRGTTLVLVGTAPAEEEADPEGPQSTERRATAGPPGSLPPTVGEVLLTDERAAPKRRIVLVMRVRLPDAIFPENPVPTNTANGNNE